MSGFTLSVLHVIEYYIDSINKTVFLLQLHDLSLDNKYAVRARKKLQNISSVLQKLANLQHTHRRHKHRVDRLTQILNYKIEEAVNKNMVDHNTRTHYQMKGLHKA